MACASVHRPQRPASDALQDLGAEAQPRHIRRSLDLLADLRRQMQAMDPSLCLLHGLFDQRGAGLGAGAGNARIELERAFDERAIVRISPKMELQDLRKVQLLDGALKLLIGRSAKGGARALKERDHFFGNRRRDGFGRSVGCFSGRLSGRLEDFHQRFLAEQR